MNAQIIYSGNINLQKILHEISNLNGEAITKYFNNDKNIIFSLFKIENQDTQENSGNTKLLLKIILTLFTKCRADQILDLFSQKDEQGNTPFHCTEIHTIPSF